MNATEQAKEIVTTHLVNDRLHNDALAFLKGWITESEFLKTVQETRKP